MLDKNKYDQVAELAVYCPFYVDGCTWSGKRASQKVKNKRLGNRYYSCKSLLALLFT